MRKFVLCLCILCVALVSFGCHDKNTDVSDAERNAPAPVGGPSSGPGGGPGTTAGQPAGGGGSPNHSPTH